MRYLLDTNSVISLLNNKDSRTAQRARLHKPADIGVSAIVIHELFYGAFKSQRSDKNVALVDALQFEVLSFDKEDAREAGELRAILGRRGTPIGSYDVLIAGQAKARDLILITGNLREFARVSGLDTENWET